MRWLVTGLLSFAACSTGRSVAPDGNAPGPDGPVTIDTRTDSSRCGSGLSWCSGRCVDLLTDPGNCGSCGNRCASRQLCIAGICQGCACTPPLVCYGSGSQCVDLSTDALNCGACGNACPPGGTCANGACPGCGPCPPGYSCCGVACVNTSIDPKNCGTCGTDCGGGTCKAGACCLQVEAEDAAKVTATPAGSWSKTSCNCGGGGALAYYSGSSATLSFAITGTSLTARYLVGPTYKTFTVTIDGGAPISVDPGANDFDFTTKVIVTGLQNTSHSVLVSCASPNCEFDYFSSCK